MKRLITVIVFLTILIISSFALGCSNSVTTTIKEAPMMETIIVVDYTPMRVIDNSMKATAMTRLTEEEKLIFATLLRLECGGSSYETKLAVASVIINRMNYWKADLRSIVFAQNQFSPARLIDRETGKSYYNPSKTGAYADCWKAMEEVLQNGPSIPYYVMYFRTKYYHSWTTPYAKIGSMYFSYSHKYM